MAKERITNRKMRKEQFNGRFYPDFIQAIRECDIAIKNKKGTVNVTATIERIVCERLRIRFVHKVERY